jgi:spectinomycin phosphotransferase
VLTPPPDLDEDAVTRLVRDAWGLPISGCSYLAQGMGSHHWLGYDDSGIDHWFITADRVRTTGQADELAACFQVVSSLARQLPFVLGPQPALDGSVVQAAALGSLLVSVRDYLAGDSGRFGRFERPEGRLQVLRALADLHALPVPPELPRWQPDDYPDLILALDEVAEPWDAVGPFTGTVQDLVRTHASSLRQRLADFAAASAALTARRHDVISHGEPHAANVLWLAESASRSDARRRTPASKLQGPIALLDWDTVRAAPKERDLAVALPDADSGEWAAATSAYVGAGGSGEIDIAAVGLFREEWGLNDIDVTLRELRAPHLDSEDTRAALDILGRYLSGNT